MRDQYEDRLLNDHRRQMMSGIDQLLRGVMQAFRVLHRISWSAPWTAPPHRRSCGC
ncbi:MAG: hypothetical protein QHC40_04555 [Sphingobium sp.]|nr:hypothetical protein [Sphingobium sp.]